MRFEDFILKVKDLSVIDSNILLAGESHSAALKVQLSRWAKAGKLIQLKRGIYVLAQPYRKMDINEFVIASVLKAPSYISLEKALEYHGLIPEAVGVFTSVTTKRPTVFKTQVGTFDYRHLSASLFWGYDSVEMSGSVVFMAKAEKALLDFFYLRAPKVTKEYIRELRLQNLGSLDPEELLKAALKFDKSKVIRAAELTVKLIEQNNKEQQSL